MAILTDHHYEQRSFVKQGPIRFLESEHGEEAVLALDCDELAIAHDDISQIDRLAFQKVVENAVETRLESKTRWSKFDPKNAGHVMLLVTVDHLKTDYEEHFRIIRDNHSNLRMLEESIHERIVEAVGKLDRTFDIDITTPDLEAVVEDLRDVVGALPRAKVRSRLLTQIERLILATDGRYDEKLLRVCLEKEAVDHVTFSEGSATIPINWEPQNPTYLKDIRDKIKLDAAERLILIKGYASGTGRSAANMSLADARADATKAHLISLFFDEADSKTKANEDGPALLSQKRIMVLALGMGETLDGADAASPRRADVIDCAWEREEMAIQSEENATDRVITVSTCLAGNDDQSCS